MSRDKLAFAGNYAYNWPMNNKQGGRNPIPPYRNTFKKYGNRVSDFDSSATFPASHNSQASDRGQQRGQGLWKR